MKILLTLILASYCIQASCQEVIKYYDDKLSEVPAEKAVYYTKLIKDGNVYQCTTYFKDNNALRGKSTYTDTAFSSPEGVQVTYDRKGHLEDSTYYEDG